jgi:hypothetical protein
MRRWARLVRALVVLVSLGACRADPDAPGPAAAAVTNACDVMPGGPGGPINDPIGPYYHQVVVGRTADGRSVTSARQVLDHASVPDGVRRPDGTVLIYYVNGATGATWVARLEGDSAVAIGPISLNGVSSPGGVVDPDATAMPNGTVRLAYLSGFGPPTSTRARGICVAESSDGVQFTVVGQALSFPSTELATDPSLAQLTSGAWLMAISLGQQTIIARSADGLTFAREALLTYGGVPEITRLADGRVRLYVCKMGIESYVSSDDGRSWTREGIVVPPGAGSRPIVCDPSMVSGTEVFIYKTG